MSEFVTVMVAAMVAQLFVLPGEKVQFIIAGLSTRFRPVVVVSAAGLAFAGWTALEIWFGEALQGALPPVYLDVISGGLFVLFGVLLVRSVPAEGAISDPAGDGLDGGVGDATGDVVDGDSGRQAQTDGGMLGATGKLDVSVAGFDVPDRFGSFLPIFVLMATGEFGDKTQLVTIGLAVEYGAHPGIWLGEMLVIIPVSLVNAYFFSRFSGRFDVRKAHYAGAALFFFFGLDTLLAVLTGFSVWETAVDAVGRTFWTVAEAVAVLSAGPV